MTSYVKILESTQEHQSLSLYHELMRDAPSTLPSPNQDEKDAFIDQMVAKVQTSTDFTAARKRSLIDRLEAAREADVPGDIYFATQRIENRARVARVALDDYYNRTARELGESVAQVRARLGASYEESRRERTMVAPAEWVTEYRRRPGQAGLPMDRHTAYAMWRIDNEIAERQGEVQARPVVTNHQRVNGTGLSQVGYSPETGRLEVEFRSRPGQFYAYRNVPADVHAQIMASSTPTATFTELVRTARGEQRGFSRYAYTSQAEADAAAVQQRCRSCGQWMGEGHGCPPRGSNEEVAATVARARVQQRVLRARRAVASGTYEERMERLQAQGLTADQADARIADEDRTAEMSPDTTMRHRQNQRLQARIYPYRGESGTFRCTALSTVRDILEEETQAVVPVSAMITRTNLDGRAVTETTAGALSGRVTISRNGSGGYEVTPVTSPGDSGEDQLKCTCLDYRRNYDCAHVRQLVGDIQRRINQSDLRSPHAIADQTAFVDAEAQAANVASVAAQAEAQGWHDSGDGVTYAGAEGASTFQADYTAAKNAWAAGEMPVQYMTENATDGLGAEGTGRAFGTEIEFSFPNDMSYEDRAESLQRIGWELYEAGLTSDDRQQDYHESAARGYTTNHAGGWSFEEDGSVEGEIVSPIMYDTPETWANLQKVCDILQRNGAVADRRTGGHIHVSTGNYDHDVDNHNRLVGIVNENEDTLYRLATNPATGTHRSATGRNGYTQPNPRVAGGFSSIGDAARANRGYVALNLQDCATGRNSDHAEFRVWDGSLSPAIIQTQIKMSLAMTEAAFRDTDYQPTGHQRFGSTARSNRETRREAGTNRLTGEQWRASTESFRSFADQMFRRHEDKRQMAALFAGTTWQRPSR